MGRATGYDAAHHAGGEVLGGVGFYLAEWIVAFLHGGGGGRGLEGGHRGGSAGGRGRGGSDRAGRAGWDGSGCFWSIRQQLLASSILMVLLPRVRRFVAERGARYSKDVDGMIVDAGRHSTVKGSSDNASHSKPSGQCHVSEDVTLAEEEQVAVTDLHVGKAVKQELLYLEEGTESTWKAQLQASCDKKVAGVPDLMHSQPKHPWIVPDWTFLHKITDSLGLSLTGALDAQ